MNSKNVNILLEKIFAETGLGKWLAKKAAKNSSTPLYMAAMNVSIQSKDCMHVATVLP